ncbi:MAG: hypothetical protein M3144_03150, partial [Actinomycetota bacterium]|nr:hypothetical protein [Actinomycetota bacterium]
MRATQTGANTGEAAAMLLANRPLDAEHLHQLQRDAGNQAVALTIQEQVAVQRQPETYTSANRPKKGADVRAALRTHLPGLLPALTEEQVAQWQKIVDYYAVTRHIQKEGQQLYDSFKSNYPGLDPKGFGPYNEAVARLERAFPRKPATEKLKVDPNLLLADDVTTEPEWDVKAEMAYRQWALAEWAKDPPEFDMFPEHDDEVITRRTSVGSFTTKGLITLHDLHRRFMKEYNERVVARPEWGQLYTALAETKNVYAEATALHRERNEINKRNEGVFGIDIIRNIAEALGEGDEDYPTIHQWEEPKKLLATAEPLLMERKFEVAVPLLAMAELSTAKAADRIFKYDYRIESGAGVAVKWLGRIKTVGSIAAGIAAGPLGMTGSALVAGGYTFVQEGAQNVSAMAHGQRTDLGAADLIKKAGIATVLGLMGGALQPRFQAAISARVAQATGTAGGAIRDMATSAAAASTLSVYQTAAEAVLQNVIEGKAFPKNATELSDLIVDKALQAAAMDVALRGPSARAAREYQTWKAGKATSLVPGRSVPGQSKQAAPAPDAPEPRNMPEDVAQRLLRDSGGWQRLRTELVEGTGLANGMTVPERRALLDRFEASRELLARDVAGMFEGSVAVTDAGAGRQIEVRFVGDKAAQHQAEAKAYLDTKRPGWEAQTGLSLQHGPAPAAVAGPKSMKAISALRKATPEARQLAARLAPLYENWTGKSPLDRARMLVEVVNEQLRAAGTPEVTPALTKTGAGEDGLMKTETWDLFLNSRILEGHTQTPEQFAYACGVAMHEGYHAQQLFRAARTNPIMAKPRFDPDVFQAVVDANAGRRGG